MTSVASENSPWSAAHAKARSRLPSSTRTALSEHRTNVALAVQDLLRRPGGQAVHGTRGDAEAQRQTHQKGHGRENHPAHARLVSGTRDMAGGRLPERLLPHP